LGVCQVCFRAIGRNLKNFQKNVNTCLQNAHLAIKAAIKSCMERGILVYFLEKHASEVLNMLTTEWNWDDAKEVWQEEAREERDLHIAKNMLADGIEPTRVARITKLPEEQIRTLM